MRNFDEAIKKVKGQAKVMNTVIIAADEHAIQAALQGEAEGLVKPIFVGDEEEIKKVLDAEGATGDYEILHADSLEDCARIGVTQVSSGKAELILKGHIDTSILLKAVVNKEYGIGTGQTITHMAFQEVDSYHKIFVVTDGGVIPYPSLEQKEAIIRTNVETLRRMGWEQPKVAVVCAIEKVNPGMPETVDAGKLKEMNQAGEIENCIVEGPISFDLAYDKEAVALKKYESPVGGDADIFLAPNLVCGNILSKSLTLGAPGQMAGLVVGAKVPILLNSRSSSAKEKYLSLVMAQLYLYGAKA